MELLFGLGRHFIKFPLVCRVIGDINRYDQVMFIIYGTLHFIGYFHSHVIDTHKPSVFVGQGVSPFFSVWCSICLNSSICWVALASQKYFQKV